MSVLRLKAWKKFLVVGPIYDKIEVLPQVEAMLPNYELVIFNGNVSYPNDDIDKVKIRLGVMDRYLQPHRVIYNMGNYDFQLLKKLEDEGAEPYIRKWFKKRSNVVLVQMPYQNIIITSGGIAPKMTQEELFDGVEASFVSKVNDSPWHRWYGGAYGYVISNNPLTQGEPQYYNYSAQIGNLYSDKVQIYAQEVQEGGLGKSIPLEY